MLDMVRMEMSARIWYDDIEDSDKSNLAHQLSKECRTS